MKVITIASDIENPFLSNLLVPSCHAVGLDLVILHLEKSNFRPSDKRAVLVDYLRGGREPEDLILFTDAYDTMFVKGEDFIRGRYAEFSQSVVFSAESNSYPLGAVGLALHDSPPVRPYPYLNSGGFIGRAGDFLDLYAKYPTPPSDRFKLLQHLREHGYDTDRRFRFSDQYYWGLVQLLEPETVGLDHKTTIFEYLGPAYPDVRDMTVLGEWYEFRVRGREADGYQPERARLVQRLQAPSGAAQLHFASPITKAVALDLFEEAALPCWLHAFLGPRRQHYSNVEVRRV